jgi:hypothetical protein
MVSAQRHTPKQTRAEIASMYHDEVECDCTLAFYAQAEARFDAARAGMPSRPPAGCRRYTGKCFAGPDGGVRGYVGRA